MPSVPEFLDIFTEKRLVEVVRNLYAKQIARSHRHQTVTCKVKEQIKAICVHIYGC